MRLASPTPLERLGRLSRNLGIDLFVKRDDLFAVSGGGNKARKLQYMVRDAEQKGCDALVTTGGTQSNQARVAAILAASKGWRCELVLHGDPEELRHPSGNLLLMTLAGASVTIVPMDSVGEQLDHAVERLSSEGRNPMLLPGRGYCQAGGLAYVNAVQELLEQCSGSGWRPDYILLASGTGTTQSGLLAGLDRHGVPAKVIGISISRPNPRGAAEVEASYTRLAEHLGLAADIGKVHVRDEWTRGGYQRHSAEDFETIAAVAKTEALYLDPTYTAKAFTALLQMARNGEIERGSRVLFWHTGGLLNLLSSMPLERGAASELPADQAI